MAGVVALALVLTGGRASCWAAQPATAMPRDRGSESSAPGAASAAPRAMGGNVATASMADEYGAREANAKGLENYKGGDVVIIGSGGAILLLLIILILVLA